MTKHLLRTAGLGVLLMAAAPAIAQTARPTTPDGTTSSAPRGTTPNNGQGRATPNAITPPGGIARGVIRPTGPVDPQMVTRPPAQADHPMPVITPPGTAR